MQVLQGAPYCRAGIRNIIHDGHALPRYYRVQRRRKTIDDGKQFIRRSVCKTRGVSESASEFFRDQKPDESTFHKRAADHMRRIWPELSRKLRNIRAELSRVAAERLKIKPEFAVMSGLVKE